MAAPPAPPLPPDVLERLRTIGLRVDRTGRLWHLRDEVTHPGLRRAILRWLDVSDDGRAIVRLDGDRFAYIDIDDTHLRVTAIHWHDDRPIAFLDDGTEPPLAMATLVIDRDHRARCLVRGGRLTARLSSAAQQVLFERAEQRADQVGIAADGQFWPLA
jgi:hypothetical protein